MDPFDFFNKIQKELNRRFDRFDKKFLDDYRKPSCNISQDKNNINIEVDLPGIAKKDIFLHIGKHDVEIRAEKRKTKVHKGKRVYHKEKTYKGYHRVIPIPADILPDKAKAKAKRGGGVIITIPKAKIVTRRIRVR